MNDTAEDDVSDQEDAYAPEGELEIPPPGTVDAAAVVQDILEGEDAGEPDPVKRPDDPRAGYQR